MYDMPDDEIIGFWGKRPFVGKRIPYRSEPPENKCKPAEVPAVRLLPAVTSFTEPAIAEAFPSWRTDPALLRHNHPHEGTSDTNIQT